MTPTIADQRVLVTGGAGFIGSHIAETLCPDNDVLILDDFSSGNRTNCPDGATVIEGDVRDEATVANAVDGVDIVFHEAAIVSVAQSVENPTASHAVNVDGMLNVLEAARREDARVVFASSAAIYGAPESLPVTETAPKQPASPYGLEKLSGDHYCRLYADLYDLQTVSLRYFNVYGPRQSGGDYAGAITAFAQQARAGGPLTVHGDGSQTRDFVNIADVVQANLLAATTDATGEAFNVGTGTGTTIRGVAETIRDTVDPTAEVTTTDPRPGDIRDSLADISKARERLGYDPNVSLTEGLETYLG
ncbi:NAD-dependent epimerase/dehydratase family protein [Haloarcula sp. CBA1130]|uniref:NAD-dependent epimerase/dehydratase family protein n=1 Tax=unclassified Haloarcula TaxID=2624677 RepID=UPI0012491C27|nr:MULTISPECIES: NAD-dependent epimerase/dehydratase family protein [unclassified Haloarcula]KAA9396482.1 NAD-dependent epimerase/dehydratase family protein [Haloarcula sp. CBA1130]KAA9397661.1 NAD-dependent epimerase/dehydratase family protein [Haloarcula sp. CBA1129]